MHSDIWLANNINKTQDQEFYTKEVNKQPA